jgi:DNA-binding beta-propeller fold protein YncE
VPEHGNGGFHVFDLDAQGLPTTREATGVIGRPSLLGRRSVVPPTAREPAFPGSSAVYDNTTDRLFVVDALNNRILVYDAGPGFEDFPAASVVIGQPNFTSRTFLLTGPNRFGFVAGAVIDEANQRLFVSDLLNHRVLVFDVHPDRLRSDPPAQLVLGQDHPATSGLAGPSPPAADRLNAPTHLAYDVEFDRLFVGDVGNHRVLVFDARPEVLSSGDDAIAVMGQDDFVSAEPREDMNQLAPAQGILDSMGYDWVHHRLFIGEGGSTLHHRVMVFDAHPDRVGGRATAMAVIGQATQDGLLGAVSQQRLLMPRPVVEPSTQKLYVSEGFPGGNRVMIFDIRPEQLRTGMPAVDVIGHVTPDGRPDFDNRMAQGHLDGRSIAAARAVALDPVDHRLFVADQYNHRVVVYPLDRHNRVAGHDAVAVLGQPDLATSHLTPPTASNMGSPLAVAYDTTTRRLYVGDGIHNRVLVYDAAPSQLRDGMAATSVLGQPDFTTVAYRAGRSGLNFDVRGGRGIASEFLPMGLAVDERRQRLFVSDGGNNRILVYDVSAGRVANGLAASAVLGQRDFQATDEGSGAAGLADPGHLAYDPVNDRLFAIDARHFRILVFDVAPARLADGAAAVAVVGQPDLEATDAPGGPLGALGFLLPYLQVEPLPALAAPTRPTPADRLAGPNGIAYDAVHQLLYVSDAGGLVGGGAHRVAVFDVAPQRLENGPEALRVIGKRDADEVPPPRQGGASSYPGQFRVHDPRGIAMDGDNGVLYVTDSLTSRVLAYYLPRATWRAEAGPGAWTRLSTLDAVDLDYRSQPATTAVASLQGGLRAGVVHYLTTEMEVDEATQRHSRVLTGEVAVPLAPAATTASFFVDDRADRTHTILLSNAGGQPVDATLEYHDTAGVVAASAHVVVPAGAQVVDAVADLLAVEGDTGLLTVDATGPVAATVLQRTSGDGTGSLAPAPARHAAHARQPGCRSGRRAAGSPRRRGP